MVYGKIVKLDGTPDAWSRVQVQADVGVGAASGWVMPGLIISGSRINVRAGSDGVFYTFLPRGTRVTITLGADLAGTSVLVPEEGTDAVDLSVLAFDYPAEFRWQFAFSQEPTPAAEVPAWETAPLDGRIVWLLDDSGAPVSPYMNLRLVAVWNSGKLVKVVGNSRSFVAEDWLELGSFTVESNVVPTNKWRAAGYEPKLRSPATDSLDLPHPATIEFSQEDAGDEGGDEESP